MQTGKVGIAITTYESGNKVLTHVFWGDDLESAFGVARSHLITDHFFSSSFEGRMKWGTDVLKLTNEGRIVPYNEDPERIMDILAFYALSINGIKESVGLTQVLDDIRNIVKSRGLLSQPLDM